MLGLLNLRFDAGKRGAGSKKCATDLIISFSNPRLSQDEPIEVDSLVRGWYRVVADGRGVGYVDQRLVQREPPVGEH